MSTRTSSASRAVEDLLAAWRTGISVLEWRALEDLQVKIAAALEAARNLPPCIDRRCAALVLTRLEEAEHWALSALRVAIDRRTLPDPVDVEEGGGQ